MRRLGGKAVFQGSLKRFVIFVMIIFRQEIDLMPSVNFASVINCQYQNNHFPGLDITNYPPPFYSITPKTSKGPFQCLSFRARITQAGYVVQVVTNLMSNMFVELPELTFCRVRIFNLPSQDPSLQQHQNGQPPLLCECAHARSSQDSNPPCPQFPVRSFLADNTT
jgi:hypothetical protein